MVLHARPYRVPGHLYRLGRDGDITGVLEYRLQHLAEAVQAGGTVQMPGGYSSGGVEGPLHGGAKVADIARPAIRVE